MRAFLGRLNRRLALPEAFGWPTFWLAAFVYFGTTVLFDARRFGGPVELWILSWAIGQALILGWVILAKHLFLDRLKRQRARVLTVLLIGTTAGIARGIFLATFSTGLAFANEPQLGFRLGGGAIAGFVVTIAGAALIGASVEHQRVIRKLTETRDALLQTRSAAPELLSKAREDIAKLASDTLLPRLRSIDQALVKSKISNSRVSAMADEIRGTLTQEVRPMSSSLAQRVEKSLSVQPESPDKVDARLGLPKRFDLSGALAPGVTFGIALMLCLATFVPLTDPVTTGLSVVGALFLLLSLELAVRLLRPLKPVSLPLGTVLLALIGALSTVPLSILTQWSLPTFLNLSSMPVQSATIIAVLAVGIGFTRIVDTERAEFEKELNEFNLVLERELKWIDAQIWVIRRDWAYLLHGRVQSALTAALARVGDAKSVTAETIKLVHKDIERARQALFEGIGGPFDLEASLAEIAESWQGICELNLKFEPSAIKSVHEDIGLARSINEILREAISNAVRHGDAGNVVVALTQNGGVLNLKVTNDGGPVTEWSRSSLGSEMLDELTLDWSLSNQGKRVVLEARLAKATASF